MNDKEVYSKTVKSKLNFKGGGGKKIKTKRKLEDNDNEYESSASSSSRNIPKNLNNNSNNDEIKNKVVEEIKIVTGNYSFFIFYLMRLFYCAIY